jgi:hypothetical protein
MTRAIIEALRKHGIIATVARGGFLLSGEGFLSAAAAKDLVGFDEGRMSRHHAPTHRQTDWLV